MAKISKIKKFLTALFDNGGEMGRAQLAVAVFRRNWSAAQLDDLINSPEIRGLVAINRSALRGRHAKGTRKRPRGRPSTRYSLTGSGWALLTSGLRHGVQPHHINVEEVRRQFEMLLQDHDPWAVELSRQAATGIAAEAVAEHKRAEARAVRQAATAARPRPKRQRTEQQIQERREWFDAKMLEQGKVRNAEGKYRPIEQVQAIEQEPAPALGDSADFRRYVSLPIRRPDSAPRPTPSESDKNTTTLLARIARAGYRTERGKVWFDNRLIDPQEWVQRMPGCLD